MATALEPRSILFNQRVMSESSQKSLSPEARELVGMINGLAAEIMYDQYKNLTIQMKIRLANLIKNTQGMLDDD